MKLLEEFLKRELNDMMKDGIRLRAIGNLSGLPAFAQRVVRQTIEKTKHNSDWNLTLALNYGSRQEVLEAVHSYSKTHKSTTQKPEWTEFARHLQTHELPDPDLIIRTSGEYRLCTFLQAAYAEIFVSPYIGLILTDPHSLMPLRTIFRERDLGKQVSKFLPPKVINPISYLKSYDHRTFSSIILWGLIAAVVYGTNEPGAMWVLNLCATYSI